MESDEVDDESEIEDLQMDDGNDLEGMDEDELLEEVGITSAVQKLHNKLYLVHLYSEM